MPLPAGEVDATGISERLLSLVSPLLDTVFFFCGDKVFTAFAPPPAAVFKPLLPALAFVVAPPLPLAFTFPLPPFPLLTSADLLGAVALANPDMLSTTMGMPAQLAQQHVVCRSALAWSRQEEATFLFPDRECVPGCVCV